LLDAIDLQSLVLTKEKENSRYLEESKEEEFYSFNHVLNGLKETESLLIKHEENKMVIFLLFLIILVYFDSRF